MQLARAVPNKSVDTAAIDGLRWRRAQAAAGQVVVAVGRARDREVAAYGGADRTDRFGTARTAALLLLAAAWRQRLAPYHRR